MQPLLKLPLVLKLEAEKYIVGGILCAHALKLHCSFQYLRLIHIFIFDSLVSFSMHIFIFSMHIFIFLLRKLTLKSQR